MIQKDAFLQTLKKLVSAPSVSGTEKENICADTIMALLKEIPYFAQNPHNLEFVEIENDPFHRKFVSAFFKSNLPTLDTVIITGHLDVVDVEDFGHLKQYAFDVDAYTARCRELLKDESALQDYDSGDYLFGRGTADMKYGIALCIELLREISAQADYPGNVLFLAVPGEESNSEGMLATVPYIKNLTDDHGYRFKACCVTECAIPRWAGDETKRIYTGTVGKVMPLFFAVGKETHVADSLSGLNPTLIISEINRLMEINADFCDYYMGESNPPPTCLKQTDLKELYNVQTPIYAASYYNLLTLRASGRELMDKLRMVAQTGFENALRAVSENAEKFRKRANIDTLEIQVEPLVMTYHDLYEKVMDATNGTFEGILEQKIAQWQSQNLNNQTIAIQIVRETYEHYPDKRPMVILSFAPPYYPHKHLDPANPFELEVANAVDGVLAYARERFGLNMEKEHFYKAICDLSYTGIGDIESVADILGNMPALNRSYHLPIEELLNMNIPGIVFGGYGKDFHKNSERLSLSYNFDVVPELYLDLLRRLFQ